MVILDQILPSISMSAYNTKQPLLTEEHFLLWQEENMLLEV